MNRYSNKRHQGPTHRGLTIREAGWEGNIPVIVAQKLELIDDGVRMVTMPTHIRAFYCHPRKGWRSTGPEGRR